MPQTKSLGHRANKMYMTLTDFYSSDHGEIHEYAIERIDQAVKDAAAISQYFPCHAMLWVTQEGNKFFFDHTMCFLDTDLQLSIEKQSRDGKYSIYVRDLHNFKNISHYSKDNISKSFPQPKHIGVLTTKKIQDWVNYWRLYVAELKIADDQNKANIQAFKESMVDLPVEWNNPNQTGGRIYKGGFMFSFTISEGSINTSIDLQCPRDLQTFKLISLNAFSYGK
jgi:hypothetical protein